MNLGIGPRPLFRRKRRIVRPGRGKPLEKMITQHIDTDSIHLNTNTKVLVTGGAGFLGSHICEKLLLEGKDVVVVDMLNHDTSSLTAKERHIEYLTALSQTTEGAKFKMYKLDILEENLLGDVLREEAPTSCIHAAALVMDRKSVEEPIRYIINNVQGTQSLLNAIHKTGTIEHFVLISSRSAVGETDTADGKVTEDALLRPRNPYGATKVAMEALCHAFHKNFGLSVSVCRLQPLYGPRSRRDMMPSLLFEGAIHNKVVKKFGSGSAIRDWLYVGDAANGVLAALKNFSTFSIFNFGTGTGTTLNDLIWMVTEITGKKINLVYEDVLPGDTTFAGVCDNRKAKKLLGWEPKIDLNTGLKIMYEYMKKNQDI